MIIPNAIVFPLPIEPMPIAQAVPRLWHLRRLFREHALDAIAGRLAVAPFSVHPNDKVARLAVQTLAEFTPAVPA